MTLTNRIADNFRLDCPQDSINKLNDFGKYFVTRPSDKKIEETFISTFCDIRMDKKEIVEQKREFSIFFESFRHQKRYPLQHGQEVQRTLHSNTI